MKGCRWSLGSIGQRLAALFGQCVRDHFWDGDQSFGQYGSPVKKQGESRLGLRLSPHTEATGRFTAQVEVPIHRPHQPGISCLPIRSTQTPGTSLELTGLSPAWRSAQGPKLSVPIVSMPPVPEQGSETVRTMPGWCRASWSCERIRATIKRTNSRGVRLLRLAPYAARAWAWPSPRR